MLRRLLYASFSLALAAVPAAAQGCTGNDTFWKRDSLPASPAGLTAVSVIPGLCEGESIGVVFEMPANMPPQKVTQVVAPWGAQGGVGGFQAQLDVLVYDGVSFVGGVPNMGNLVFQLTNTGSGLQVQSQALNTFDTSSYDIVVGLAAPTGTPAVRRFAVCFRTDLNAHPTGTCGSGYPANYFTDNGTFQFTCTTPLRTNLIEIQGQGWRDAALAQVSGIPLCPIFFNGNWCIRACTRDAFPASYVTYANGCPSTLGTSQLLPATMPRIGTNLFVIVDKLPFSLGAMLTGFSDTNAGGVPLPLDVTFLGLPGCSLQTSAEVFQGLTGGGTTASYLLSIPNQQSLLGAQLYQQVFVIDPPLNSFGGALSDAARMTVGL